MNPAYRIEWISPLLLIPYTYNARTHSDEQVDKIMASMQEFGWTNPILIDAKNQIIAGHGRLAAAEKLGYDKVPCLRLTNLDESQQRAYVLADNKLAELAGWDTSMLRLELADLKADGFDLDLIGFSAEEVESILKGLEGEGDGNGEGQDFTLQIYSKDEAEIIALRNIFGVAKHANRVDATTILNALPE